MSETETADMMGLLYILSVFTEIKFPLQHQDSKERYCVHIRYDELRLSQFRLRPVCENSQFIKGMPSIF